MDGEVQEDANLDIGLRKSVQLTWKSQRDKGNDLKSQWSKGKDLVLVGFKHAS